MSDEIETNAVVAGDGVPEGWADALDEIPRHNQMLVDLLAGRPGYVIPDSPDPMVRSVYQVTSDGIWWEHPGRGNDAPPVRTLIATRPFLVRSRLRDDQGKSRYVVAWLSDDGEVETVNVGADLLNARTLLSIFPEAVVDSNTVGHCVDLVKYCLWENREWVVRYGETVATALGWPEVGTSYFVSGPDRPVTVEDVKNTGGWLRGHRERGTLDASVAFLSEVADRPQLQVMVNASLASPVLRVVGADNFVVDLCGETSTGKTRALMLAASMWGEPTTRGVLAMWNMTRTAIEEHLSVLRGVPMFLDETQLARPEDVGDVVYGVTQGKSRGRGRREGGLQDVTSFETVLLITGEQPAVKLAETKPGVMPRVVEVTGTPCRDKDQADELTSVTARNFGHVGPAFVEFLRGQDEVSLTLRLTDLKRELAGHAQSRLAGRRADSVAVLWLTNQLAHEAGLVPLVALETWTWLMNGGDAVTADDEDVPRKALRHLLHWAWSNKTSFYGGSDDPFTSSRDTPGRWAVADGYVAISSSLAPRILDKLGYTSPDMLFGAWKERGWLACQGGKGRTWRVPVGGGIAPAMYKITMLEDIVASPGQGDEVDLEVAERDIHAAFARGLGTGSA